MRSKPSTAKAAALRQRAEKRLRSRRPAIGGAQSEMETRRLVHELEVHQIELEMQNEELRGAQQRLEESRDHYAAFYDFAPVGYVTFDAGGIIREINLTAADMLGVPRARLSGQPFHPFVAEEDLAHFLRHLRKRANAEERVGTEFSLVRKGRAALPVVMQSVPACGAEKHGHHCRATLTDLSARQQADETLRGERDFIDAVLEASGGLILVLDEAGRVLRFNRACEQLSGYSSEEMVGQAVWILLPPEEAAGVRGVFEELRIAHHPNRYENHWLTKTGERRLIAWANTVLTTAEGKVSAIIATGIDLTERRRLEAEVLEIMDREQQRIGLDLHDGLGQQLTAIGLRCHALRLDLAPHPHWEQEAATLSGLLSDAIRQTRALSHGLVPLQLGAIGLKCALDELARTTSIVGKVECRLQCATGMELADSAVSGQLYRIAQEAVTNALKHGAPDRIEIKFSRRNGTVRLRISDNGKGFPTPRKPHGGMGLGVMKYRADLVGGTLLVASKPGQGVTVDCTVPLQKS